jgi:hypothetical protein
VVAQHGSIPDETRRTRLAKTTHHVKEVVVMNQSLQFPGALMLIAASVAAQHGVLSRQKCPSLSST